jgi:hypothetical protein
MTACLFAILVSALGACSGNGTSGDGGAGAPGGAGGSAAGAGGGAAGAGGGAAGAGGGAAGAGGGAAGAGGGAAGAGGGAAGRGGAGGGNAACASAVLDATCTTPELVCGGESCTNACQFCNLLRCTSGRWQRMEAFPAPCFACGAAGLRCQTNAEYCNIVVGGIPTSQPTYACVAVPASCRPTPTCSCLLQQNVPGSCTQASAGELTMTLAAP